MSKKKKKVGRPSKYKPEYCKSLVNFFSIEPILYKDITITKADGTQIDKTETEAAPTPYFVDWQIKIDIDNTTMLEWVKKHPEFSRAYNRAKQLQEKFLMECGLKEVHGGFITALTLKNVSGWRDKQDIEHTGEVKGQQLILIERYKKDDNAVNNRISAIQPYGAK